MSATSEIARRKSAYAQARTRHTGISEAYTRLRAAVHDELAHEVCMKAARAELARMDRTRRDLRTLRETLAFEEVRS